MAPMETLASSTSSLEAVQHWQNSAVSCQQHDSKITYIRKQSIDCNTKYAVLPVDATMAVLLFEIQQILVQRMFFIQKEYHIWESRRSGTTIHRGF